MKFLVDAQLPLRLCVWLNEAGHDARHTLSLPRGNRSTDAEIIELAHLEQRTVITKDDDFVQNHLISGRPEKLLLIATGNISNSTLEDIFQINLKGIEDALAEGNFVELGNNVLIMRG